MTVIGFLQDVEWDGDFVQWVFGIAVAMACVATGFTIPRRVPFLVLAAIAIAALVASDLLFWAAGFDPFDLYCSGVGCNRIPVTYAAWVIPPGLLLAQLGVSLRRRRDARLAR